MKKSHTIILVSIVSAIVLIIVAGLWAFFLYIGWLLISEETLDESADKEKRTIVEIGEGFGLLWEMPDISTTSPTNHTNLTLLDGKLFMLTSPLIGDDPATLSLVAFDSNTGQIEWHDEGKFWGLEVHHNDQYLFVINDLGISAYDPNSGESVWYKKPFLSGGIRSIHMTDDKRAIVAWAPSTSYLIDPLTGLANQTTEPRSSQSYSAIQKQKEFVPIEDYSIFTEDKKFSISINDQLFAFDRDSGEYLWSTKLPHSLDDLDRIISNVTVDDGIVYYLTQDARLRAVDATTGILISYVEFTPDLSQLVQGLQNYRFDVAADDGIVSVNLGSSSQVFTFDFQREE